MKITLINPKAGSQLEGVMPMFPYGLQIVAALTPDQHQIEIIDETIGQEIDFDKPVDLVGISAVTVQAPRAYAIAQEFQNRGVKVVLGGIHPSFLPEEASQQCDAVCIGEAENVWADILRDAENGNLKKIYQSDQLADLSKSPVPRRNLSPMKEYKFTSFILTSRGCPFDCSFCSVNKLFGNSYRFRPVEDVVAEVQQLKASRGFVPFDFVFFADDNIVGNHNRAKELFRALIPLKIKWVSQASITLAEDDELLSLAKQSGCIGITIGFESISDESLRKDANKRTGSIEKYKKAIQKIHAHKIWIAGSFVLGFDHDSKDVIENTLKLAEENFIELTEFNVLTPCPGTQIAQTLDAEQRILSKDWSLYDLEHVVFQPKNMSAQELQAGLGRAFEHVYSLRSILKRVIGARTGVIVPLFLNVMLGQSHKQTPSEIDYL